MTAPWLATLIGEIRANPRLRFGLWIILGILWGYGILMLQDAARIAAEEHRTISRKVARAQVFASQTDWPQRAEEAQTMQLELENRLWREGSMTLAQAAFHDWLNQTVQQAGLTHPVITMTAQEGIFPEKNPGTTEISAEATVTGAHLWKASGKLAFDFAPKKLHGLLERLATHDKRIVTESLIIRTSPTPHVDMILSANFQKPIAEAETKQ